MFHLYEKINNNDVYIIAEMSANHGGSLENALEIVRQAAAAGADCVKIQTYTADSITIDCDGDCFRIKGGLWDGYKLYDLYTDASTPYEWQAEIKAECEKCGVDFLSTPFDRDAVDFLESLGAEAYKIASFELVDIPLIEYAASKGKPMIISTGMGSIEEIQDAIDACKKAGNDKIVLLKCCSEYPAKREDMHLGNIPDMKKRFDYPIGLSDHSAGSLGAVVGVTLGACVIEKHVKLNGVDSADSGFSMTMQEFAQMVQDVRSAKTMARCDYALTDGEIASKVFRRSIFAVKDIKKGELFTVDNVRCIRPSNGIAPKHYNDLLGRTAESDISVGSPIGEIYATNGSMKTADVICTDRLILSGISEKDTDFAVGLRGDEEVYRFFKNPHKITEEEHLNWYKNIYSLDKCRYDWVAVEKASNQRVGIFGVMRENESSSVAEINYILDKNYRGMGFAREAINAVILWAKNNWCSDTAIAVVHKDNLNSIRFALNEGFTQTEKDGAFYTFRKKI